MADERLPQNESENPGLNGNISSIKENPEAFNVLNETGRKSEDFGKIESELFGNREKIFEYLRNNCVYVEDVSVKDVLIDNDFTGKKIHVILPPIGDFKGREFDFIYSNDSFGFHSEDEEINEIDKYLLSSEDMGNFLVALTHYMKNYGIELDGKDSVNYDIRGESFNNIESLMYLSDLISSKLSFNRYERTFLKGGKSSEFGNEEGNYASVLLGSSQLRTRRPLDYIGGHIMLNVSDSLKSKIIEKIPGSHYEEISLGDDLLEKKNELKNADLVLIFRDNNTYSDMSKKLKQLVEFKYGWKVYSVIIPKGTEETELTKNDKDLLIELLNTCKCITDFTVSRWTGIETKKIEDAMGEKELENKKTEFLCTALNIEKYCMQKGIDTIYIFDGMHYNGKNYFKLLEHGGLCQKDNGNIYALEEGGGISEENFEERSQVMEDSRRFRKNLFPNLKVEFVSGETDGQNFGFQFSKSKGALAILDRHLFEFVEDFKSQGGKVIQFAGYSFERGCGIEEFSTPSNNNYGAFLAEKICEKK